MRSLQSGFGEGGRGRSGGGRGGGGGGGREGGGGGGGGGGGQEASAHSEKLIMSFTFPCTRFTVCWLSRATWKHPRMPALESLTWRRHWKP